MRAAGALALALQAGCAGTSIGSVAAQPAPALGEGSPNVSAQESPAPARELVYVVEPYLWAAGITGDVRVGVGASTSVDAEFEDLLENLEGGLMLAGELWWSPQWGVLGDVTWMDLEGDATGPLGQTTVRGTNELWHAQISAAWRPPGQERVVFDVLGGVRWIDVEAGLAAGQLDLAVGETFLDPVVGARATIPLGERFQFVTQADVGGFGVGTDLSSQLLATVGWKASSAVGFGLGWRQLVMDFDEQDLAMDVTFGGPILGMRLAF